MDRNPMNRCDNCQKDQNSLSLKQCNTCKSTVCTDCLYYSRFYRKIQEEGFPDQEIDEENYFCKTHFIEFINGFTSRFLQDMLASKLLLTGNYSENNKSIDFIREFKGKDIENILSKAIDPWPSDEWKDWNTM
jgi:hypothetical protein